MVRNDDAGMDFALITYNIREVDEVWSTVLEPLAMKCPLETNI
jgi:hypothetical protein